MKPLIFHLVNIFDADPLLGILGLFFNLFLFVSQVLNHDVDAFHVLVHVFFIFFFGIDLFLQGLELLSRLKAPASQQLHHTGAIRPIDQMPDGGLPDFQQPKQKIADIDDNDKKR